MENTQLNKLIEERSAQGIEYRALEVRANEQEGENYIVEGFATTYNQPYVLWREYDGKDIYEIREQVDAHAFDEAEMDDVIMQYDHAGRVYARTTNGTLELDKANEHGLNTRADLSKTEGARSLYEDIKGGFITQMSMGFTVRDDDFEEIGKENGATVYLRTIKKIERLYDVSAVSIPANYYTEISARSGKPGQKLQAELQKKLEARKQEAEAERRGKLLERIKALKG